MRNIRLEIEYDGTNYYGWQVQNSPQSIVHSPQKRTIQQTIENTLQKILQEKVKLICAGRTDAGVHAKAQFANFRTHSRIILDKLHEALNALLPDDIAIVKVIEVPKGFHSRFNVKSKVYRYTILNSMHRSAILRNSAYFCRYPLDIRLMRQEAKVLLGKHDFSGFCASAGKKKNPVKTIKRLKITKQNDLIHVEIEADGFLYNMARNVVGTLLEAARGRLPRGICKKIIFSKDRRLAGPTVPAKGLVLLKVNY